MSTMSLRKKGDLVELLISDLAFGGAGVAKIPASAAEKDGRDFVVFVEGVAPGDRVEARFTKVKKQFAEARLERIVTPSAQRITPRCKHFGVCGGCSLQFLSYEDQIAWKEKVVRESLQKLGGFRDVVVSPIIGCASPWFYRNKMEYSFALQTELLQEVDAPAPQKGGVLGLHPKGRFWDVFDLEECFLESEFSVKIAQTVAAWVNEKKIPAFDTRGNSGGNGKGVAKNLVVREGKNTGEILVNLICEGKDFALEKEFVRMMTAAFPQVTSLYRTAVTVQQGFRTVVEEYHLAGKPTLTETLTVGPHTLTFDILPQAFFQPNSKQAQILYGKVLEFAGLGGTRTRDEAPPSGGVLDLFCGTGTIGMFFAKFGAHVTGIDLNKSAIENAQDNAKKNGIQNTNFICADVMKFATDPRPAPGTAPSLLITDPPRAGIMENALLKIIDLKIPSWIYVSCNPTTLARDLKIACQNGYSIKKVQPVDMFPQTYHVETVVLLER